MYGAFDFLYGPAIVAFVLLIVPALIWARKELMKLRQQKTSIAQDAQLSRAFRQLDDANAAVIAELESAPATYSVFPSGLRDQIYAAREAAQAAEGKIGIR